jgi:hypothetical protein
MKDFTAYLTAALLRYFPDHLAGQVVVIDEIRDAYEVSNGLTELPNPRMQSLMDLFVAIHEVMKVPACDNSSESTESVERLAECQNYLTIVLNHYF